LRTFRGATEGLPTTEKIPESFPSPSLKIPNAPDGAFRTN